MANGEPIALQWTVVPARILPEVRHEYLQPGGVTQFYEEQGVRRGRARSEYGPTRATRLEAGYLGIAVGAPLIEECRVSYHRPAEKTDDVPYEYLLSLYTERVTLTFEWRDQPPGPAGWRGGGTQRARPPGSAQKALDDNR
jgi:DNA-binding GntR family transcriptional regulator